MKTMITFQNLMRILLMSPLYLLLTAGTPTPTDVPGQFPNIQAAINAAQPGDTLVIPPGVYYEKLNFYGKNIVLASRFIENMDPAFISQTIIDGSMLATHDSMSLVSFTNGENASAVLMGFTLRNGTGTKHQTRSQNRCGGAVYIYQSSPTLRYNLILDNDAEYGGGIYAENSQSVFRNLVIKNNQAGLGAGVFLDNAKVHMRQNLFMGNMPSGQDGGSALMLVNNTGTQYSELINNTFYQNSAAGNRFSPYLGMGGAVLADAAKLIGRNNIFWDNLSVNNLSIASFNSATVQMEYSLVDGGFPGTGNFSAQPDFANAQNCLLNPASPAVDAGNPATTDYDPSDPESPGNALPPARGTRHNDAGAYGGDGLFSMPVEVTGIQSLSETNRKYLTLCSGIKGLKFSWAAEADSDLIWSVYSMENKQVHSGILKAGAEYADEDFPKGIYILRIQDGTGVTFITN